MPKGKPEEEAADEAGGEKKKFPLWVIILIAAQVVLIVGGIVAWKMLSGGHTEETELKEKAHTAAPEEKKGGGHGGGHGGGGGHGKESSSSGSSLIGPIFKLDPFIVNLLSDGQGSRFLKIDISFELESSGLEDELKKRLPQIRDEMLSLLSSRRLSDVETTDGKRILRDDIFTRINKILVTGRIKRVYFTDFVIQ